MILVFVVISSVTGILLSWKKDIALIQPKTQVVEDNNVESWLSSATLIAIANDTIFKIRSPVALEGVDRLDYRPDKGIVKVLYKKGNWEVQINATTGDILSVDKRYSDIIEKIHDGSIISDGVKLITMNGLGIALLFMSFSGFWLWFGPKRIKKIKAAKRVN